MDHRVPRTNERSRLVKRLKLLLLARSSPGEGIRDDVFVLDLYLPEILPYLYPAYVAAVTAVKIAW